MKLGFAALIAAQYFSDFEVVIRSPGVYVTYYLL